MAEHAIRIHRNGGPEVMQLETVELPPPAAGEVRVRHEAVGLNFIDVYHRTGLYPLPLPSGLGQEGAGVVEQMGADVSGFRAGDRVAYAGGAVGAYASARNIAADRLVPLPAEISCEVAAAVMLQGLTAQYLLRQTYPLRAGETILVHAAAGGVGLILCQWAKALGAHVIGTVGSEDKARLAHAHGCDEIILYRSENIAERVRTLTGGEGVAVVYDSVGADTFMASLASLRSRGLMVSFGNASGPVPPFDPLLLSRMGSLYLTRPTLMHYTARREDLLTMAGELFETIISGKVRVNIGQRHALAEVALAHHELEARRTIGATLLIP